MALPHDMAVQPNKNREREVRVVVVDGHPDVRQALRQRLVAVPGLSIVGVERDAEAVLASMSVQRPDVVLLGTRNEPVGALEGVLAAVHAIAQSGVAAVILAPFADAVQRNLFIRAGAKCYMLKDIDTPRLLAAIHEAAAADR